ncbi:MAG: serine hydrolase [Pirellulaceae bacterium]
MFQFVFLLHVMAMSVSAQDVVVEVETSSQDVNVLLEEIDAYATKVQSDWNVPGMAVAIVKDGEVIFSKGYGVRELGKDDAIDGDSLFCIASNSKAFTAAGLAILVDRGALAWDDPVTKYVPEFEMPDAFVTREMTVRDLVCHRSGFDTFSGDLLWFGTNYTSDDVMSRIRYLKPESSFRSQYGYQNLMFIAAGKVIERISGKNWGDFIEEEFLTPIGMTRTTTSISDMQENIAMPHNESGGNGMRVLKLRNLDNCWGACGLNSSVNDLAKWMNVLLADGKNGEEQLISADQVWNMMQPNTVMQLSRGAVAANPHRHFQAYGLGFFLYDYHDRKVVHHGGGMDGMISQLAIVPEENLGVVVLTNSESSASRYVRDRVLDCFLGVEDRKDASGEGVARQAAADQRSAEAREKKNAERVADTSPTLPLEDYASRFRSELYGDVTVALEGNHLVLRMVPAAEFVADLEHWHYNTFEIKWRESVMYNFPRGFVTFTIDDSGKPKQLIIDQPNDDFWFYELDLFRVDE